MSKWWCDALDTGMLTCFRCKVYQVLTNFSKGLFACDECEQKKAMSLTPEREKEIRALDRYDFCGRDMYEAFTQLLAEIDALREENKTLRDECEQKKL